ncbi:MAG TPA: hypothetical protein VNT26_06540 [Candidatus Sulfotelmatobacter sp.]|nr:hypothetical protein [Candidatus Sulfotelmatobacter sp.]
MNGVLWAKRSIWGTPQGRVGLLLLAVCWPLDWTLPGLRTAYLFFPLWLGYILAVDAWVFSRTGTSLWTRSRRAFVLLFAVSAPVWWLFELINRRTGNWLYLGGHTFSDLEYWLLSSVAFSTVMPAVFETAELVRSFRWVERLGFGARVVPTPTVTLSLFLGGLAMLALTLVWPAYFYPFVWTSLVFILEPLNRWLGRRHFLQDLQRGDWRPILSLSLGALICGFFWEMWNYYSYPKWTYHTPGAQFLHIFEMPLLGYAGYIPFALELFALKNFLWPRAPRLRL